MTDEQFLQQTVHCLRSCAPSTPSLHYPRFSLCELSLSWTEASWTLWKWPQGDSHLHFQFFFLFGILFLFFMLLFWYLIYHFKPSAILSGMRWHINTYIDAYIKWNAEISERHQTQMHPSRLLIFKRVTRRGKEREALLFKMYILVFFSDPSLPPLPSFLGNMKIKVKGGFVFWKILSDDFYIPLCLPILSPELRAASPGFLSSVLVFGQEAARSARLAHHSMEMPSQSFDGELCPWLLKWDNIRNRQDSWRAFLNHLQNLRWGQCLLCDQMSPK